MTETDLTSDETPVDSETSDVTEDAAPVQDTVEEAPVEEVAVEEAPAEEAPVEEVAAEEADTEEAAVAEEAPESDADAAVDDAPTAAEPASDAGDDVEDVTVTEVPISPYDRPGRWYVLHTQSGYENKVRKNIEARISSMNMEERIFEVVIPMEDVVEFKNGKKVVVQKKVFPGYLLCRMKLNDDSWFVVRNTPGVTGFVGAGNKPSPLPRREVESFLQVPAEGEEAARKGKPRLEFEEGETVRVKEGPFADFQGQIVEINEDQLKVKVLVNIFGRETPVELEFAQVGKL